MDDYKENLTIKIDTDDYGQVFVYPHILTRDKKVKERIKFELDSGSSYTTMSCDDLSILGYEKSILNSFKDYKSVKTAGGEIMLKHLGYITLLFEGIGIDNVNIYFSLDYEGKTLGTLLGSDFLKFFNYSVNYDIPELYIEKTKRIPPVTRDEKPLKIYSIGSTQVHIDKNQVDVNSLSRK